MHTMSTELFLIKKIALSRGLDQEDVSLLLKHNILMVYQAHEVLGYSIDKINGMVKREELTRCSPFHVVGGINSKIFILRDHKWEEVLEQTLEN